ncbi:MAG: nicotianamine synthase family protein, partial [Myxococcota bacterium]
MPPLQSSAADSAANAVAARVAVLEALRLGLERQPSLAPGLEVNAAFGKLVELCLHCPAEDADQVMEVLNRSGSTEAIRALCATGEIELEKAWAARVIEGEGRAELRRFPYFENYVDLVR